MADLVGGARTACIAWSPGTATPCAPTATRLSGRSDPVAFAPVADLALVVAPDGDGPAVFVVDLDAPGARRPSRRWT